MTADSHIPGWTFRKSRESFILIPSIAVLATAARMLIRPSWWLGTLLVILLLLWSLVLWFFRDPDRTIDRKANRFYSPADGVVNDIQLEADPAGTFLRIGIFLSVFDVHVQRAPVDGVVEFVTHHPGKNHPAYDPAASTENDQIEMGLDTVYGKVIIKQISGILARRCLNFARTGDTIRVGQRYGLIKFGSRVELYLPGEAHLLCSVGDKVQGGISVLAEINQK